MYRDRYLRQNNKNIALHKSIKYLIEPSDKYVKLGQKALTDGLYGGTTYVESWVGWEGKDGAFVIDLGDIKQIHRAGVDFLHQLGAWILLPRQVSFSYSTDGIHYTSWQTVNIPELRINKVLFKNIEAVSTTSLNARYIKIEITATKECPSWHYGVGYPSWFFIDEVIVE